MSGRIVRVLLLMALVILLIPGVALAMPEMGGGSTYAAKKTDNGPDPLTAHTLALKQTALEKKLAGNRYGKVALMAKGQYVELQREAEGAIWTLPAEFADLPHNSIPEPDRLVNNSTIWRQDFNRDYYYNLLFGDAAGSNTLRNFYIEQSANRYAVHGDVTNWVEVPGNAADYNDDLGNEALSNFLRDSASAWYDSRIAAGKTPAEIDAYLSQFDVWDRYDYDGDGNFNEPDGYIDTFQSIHSGEGEEAGVGTWAINSQSWYAYLASIGATGPSYNPAGGFRIGNSSYWVGKFVICPENGGVGVFAHEYGHDMGLPDLYDYYGENGTGFWTLMSSGSWLDEGKSTIGNKPSHMGAWEKFELGWLNYAVARTGAKSSLTLGPMEYNTKASQGAFVILPKKLVTTHIADPYAGSYFYFSGSDNNLNNKMYKQLYIPSGASLAAKVKFNIEVGYDYASLIVSNDGYNWQTVPTNLSNSSVEPNSIDGDTGGNWVDLTADLTPWQGTTVYIGFRYITDVGLALDGFMVDDINVTSYPTDGAETDAGWTFQGFRVTTGTEQRLYSQYYVLENRTYMGYDSVLKVGPYYFGYGGNPALGDLVDHFPYQDGLLINYWDTSQKDNNTALHPGRGLLLPIDAHYKTLWRVDGGVWRNRIQTYDSTFGLEKTDGIPLIHHMGVLSPVPSLPAVPLFDDRTLYYDPTNPLGSVMNPNTGTLIRVSGVNTGNFMQVGVSFVK